MTTEPKDVRGGDFRPCENEPKTPSDPPPVREAVAFAASDRACYEYPGVDDLPLRAAFVAGAVFATPDPLPVSREAVIDAIRSNIEIGAVGECSIEIVGHEAAADAILALTGETSRE